MGVITETIGERLKHCLGGDNEPSNRRRHLSLSVGMAVYKAEHDRRSEMMARINEVSSLWMHLAVHQESQGWLPSSSLIR